MNTRAIRREVEQLRIKYQTNDPYEVCRAMKIAVSLKPMGRHPEACKGFFLVNSRCQIIVINSHLQECVQKVIVTHELGHAVLHSSAAGFNAFNEFAMLDSTNQQEYEANVFAAEFLILNDTVIELMQEESDFFALARRLGIPQELLAFKFRLMKEDGYKFHSPIVAKADFLKRDISAPHDFS